MKRFNTEFKVLKAYNGDCVLIKTFNLNNDEFVILIDGGTSSTYKFSLRKELTKITCIDLLILTHIDSDHIGGLIKLFESDLISKIEISEIWINHPDLIEVTNGNLISFKQAGNLRDLIKNKKPKSVIRGISTDENEIDRENLKFEIFSPTQLIVDALYKDWETFKHKSQESKSKISSSSKNVDIDLRELSLLPFSPQSSVDNDLINASSISFLLKCPDVSLLMLADSRSEIIESELRKTYSEKAPLKCDYVKISHHGSKNNTSKSLLQIIKSDRFILSTNGGIANHRHPDRDTISRIVYNDSRDYCRKILIFTNYPISELKSRLGDFINEKDIEEGNWSIEHKNHFTIV